MEKEEVKTAAWKHRLLNSCVLAFTFILTGVALATFFIARFTEGNNNAYSIASIYVLCMLLAAPTLKVFLDKVTCPCMKRWNIAGIILIFTAIMVIVVEVCIYMVI